jgi:hypothetical protein
VGGFPCPIAWQDGYVEAISSLGADVTVRTFPDDDHFSLCDSAMPGVKAWLEDLRQAR